MRERAQQQQGQGQQPRQQQGGLGLGVKLPPQREGRRGRGKGGERRRKAEAEGLRANGVTEKQARAHDAHRGRGQEALAADLLTEADAGLLGLVLELSLDSMEKVDDCVPRLRDLLAYPLEETLAGKGAGLRCPPPGDI